MVLFIIENRVISGVCDFECVSMSVCLSVCPHSQSKMVRAINTKLGRHTVHGNCSACINPLILSKGWRSMLHVY